ncbi:MAG: GntR family transcriptional regulator [Acidimicrobiia bacterium]
MIDRSPSLTDQVKAHLKERIIDGDFDEGRIPSETELATELGVSRTTVRDALSRLEQEGAIWRKQGSGTFVNQPGLQIKSRLEEMWAYEDVLEDHGYTPSVKVLRVEHEAADQQLAAELDIEVGDQLVVVEKLFLENKKPVVLTVNRIPAELAGDEPIDGAEPLPRLLETRADRHLSYYLSEIVPVALSAHAAKQLSVRKGTPAISFEEIGFDQDNQPVAQATSFFHDDLLRFRLIRRKSGA